MGSAVFGCDNKNNNNNASEAFHDDKKNARKIKKSTLKELLWQSEDLFRVHKKFCTSQAWTFNIFSTSEMNDYVCCGS